MKFSYPSGSKPLDGYTIKRGIGVGGFGEVYFALSDAGKEVALKKIQRNLDVELRGVRQCLNLKHVNLISLWDIRTNEYGESWVVMEYVPGPSLRDVVERYPGGMPVEQIKTWFTSTASGVAYLHEHGIVHRDLKPGNIFCDEHEQVIKIGDYGLSKFISCSRQSGQTESVGTFHYMAPEIGKGVYGKEIDIYALGIILFEMLSGTVPFEGESTQEIIMKHLMTDPDVDGVPEGYRNVITKSLHKDPQRRYSNVPEMVAELPWPEIASKSQKIILQHAVGPMVLGHRAPPARESDGTQSEGATHESLETVVPIDATPVPVGTSDDESPEHLKKRNLPPVILDGGEAGAIPDIVFGPLTDNSHYIGNADPVSEVPPSQSRPAQPHPGAPSQIRNRPPQKVDPIQILDRGEVEISQIGLSPQRSTVISESQEPIAKAVQSGVDGVHHWFNQANISTPVKMALLIIAGIVVVKNSTWLLPMTIGLGTIYLLYYVGRSVYLAAESKPEKSKPVSVRLQQREKILQVRQWLKSRPASDRATELVGSLLIAALSCIVLNLLGLALGQGILELSVKTWAHFVWLTLISIVACWGMIGLTKTWALSHGSSWTRRLTLAGLGAVLGTVAFYSASSFEIDLAQTAALDFQARQTEAFVFQGIPLFPSYLIFFAGMFGILRWWKQVDPIRRTRLSIWSVTLGLIWATIFSHLLNVPLTGSCIFAVVVSISIQLASPWIHPEQRKSVVAD